MNKTKIKLFLDSVIKEDIEKYSWLIQGVTTTPTFFSREGISYDSFIKYFRTTYPNLEIHIEALGVTPKETENEVEKITNSDWYDCEKVVLKIPISFDNLKIIKKYTEKKVKFNTHLIFNPNQASLAALAGTCYVCPLVGRYAENMSNTFGKNLHGGEGDYGKELVTEVKNIVQAIGNFNKTLVMGSSIRTPGDYYNCVMGGADVVTVPTKVLDMMFNHSMTTEGIAIFLKDMGLV